MKDDHRSDDDLLEPAEPKKSKTQRKKEMIELQKLGVRLTDLPDGYLKKSGIPGDLLEAVLAAKKITAFGARKRQHQYIGTIMRGVDPDNIRRVLDDFGRPGMVDRSHEDDPERRIP
ncbi:MAG TPA: ribosome biogenesis factor YjgA [Deltaproteobacteria bacterium]|nr:ribosome biogenesis factor YjgA [Deltaproteobacteria bacterium]HPR55009.1 ribosome biogenesis factor YjgA [Deltaproteobacteria bacterium]HXK46346.1 ribosome biogenesis factor YjgA [Deltaproteobacteria bacterium]